MKQHSKQLVKRAATLLLTVCCAAALSLTAATPAFADNKQQQLQAQKTQAEKELAAAKKELQNAQAQVNAATSQKKELQNQYTDIVSQIGTLSEQLNATRDAVDAAADAVDAKQADIDAKQLDIDAKQADIDARWSDCKERMASMQMLDDGGAISILSSVSNLYELLTFGETLQEIYDKDRAVLGQMETERQELSDQKTALESDKADLEAALSDLENALTQLETQNTTLQAKQYQLAANIKQQDATISDAQALAQAQQANVNDMQKAYNDACDELDSYLRSLISQTQQNYASAPITCSLNFICPLPSYRYISCQYGDGGHKGVDFAAPGNTTIRSVADGVVTTAGWHYSYGNYVMVYHGTDSNGVTYATLYAHMIQTPSVSAGQAVQQGQTLGYVGSTGNSTGNHLHLELRVNGNRTNPLNYVPH